MAFYVVDENNNRVEGASYEEIVALLNKAINDGTLENIVKDSAFVSKLKCCVSGQTNHIAFVTQAKYNELAANNEIIPNCYYYIIDDTTCEDLEAILVELNNVVSTLDQKVKKIEGGLFTNYAITSSKNILVVPAPEGMTMKVSITGSTLADKEIKIFAPSMFTINIFNEEGMKVVTVYLGGKYEDGMIGEVIATLVATAQGNLIPKVTLTNIVKQSNGDLIADPFRVVEF